MTITETIHAGAFLQSEANGSLSREVGTAGADLVAGGVVKLSGSDLVPYDGSGTVKGIAFDAAANGDPVVYIARYAEVKQDLLSSEEQTDGTIDAGGIAGLLALGIACR